MKKILVALSIQCFLSGLFSVSLNAAPGRSNTIGMRALQYTNQFRAQNGRSALLWNQDIADLAYRHSKRMGEGKVPFGHQGFRRRVDNFPRPARAAGENVFMGTISGDVARIAVNAWINSPGHRANLLGNYNRCGIGVYQNDRGVWFFTQIFALF
jgi:uncharacterized protein YkwD